MKKFFLTILFMYALSSLTYGEGQRERTLCERIYVQTDKHLYLAGETVLMKLLTTNAEQIPIIFSKVAYVELVVDSLARIQTKVGLIDGIGSGRILLPTNLPTGYYRLIAYTQYMRNEGTDVFFEKKITVMNTFQSGYRPVDAKSAAPPLPPPVGEELPPHNFTGDASPSLWGRVGVGLQTDKTSYATRERGELTVSGLPDNMYTISVSIAGREFVPVDETDVSLFNKNQTKK